MGWRVGGKSHFKSTKQTDRAEAEKELEKAKLLFGAHKAGTLEEIYRTLSGKTVQRIPLSVAISEWLSEIKKSHGKGSSTKYRLVIEEFSKHLGATDTRPLVGEIGTEHVRNFLAGNRQKLTAKTTNLKRAIVSIFFNHAVERRLIRENPVKEIRRFKAGDDDESIRRPFTIEELQNVYSKAPSIFWRYMIIAGFYTGQRMGDLITLEWQRVDLTENVLRVKARKTKVLAHIPISTSLQSILKEIHDESGKPKLGYVFPDEAQQYLTNGAASFSLQFYTLILFPAGLVPERPRFYKRTGTGKSASRRVTPLSFHSLRHSFVSLLKATGGSQIVAKQLAGHSSDLISDNYTTLPPEILARAIDALPMLEGK